MTSGLASSFTVESAFRDQTYALFTPELVSVAVSKGRLSETTDGYVAYGDLEITINGTREELLASTSNILRSKYVNYQFPEGINNTVKDRDLADNILSSGIAEFILMSTFGSDIKKDKVIYRPNSKLRLIKDDGSDRIYLMIFGEKIYVSE
jgi:hypothetical protein